MCHHDHLIYERAHNSLRLRTPYGCFVKAYLKDGKGRIFADGVPPDTKLDELNRIFDELNDLFQDYLIIQAKELLKVQEKEENRAKGVGGGGETGGNVAPE